MQMSQKNHYRGVPALIAALALCYMAAFAHWMGFVTTDSWNYLRLAESLANGDGCSVEGEYFAMFPCGYPALISFTSWFTGLDLFAASKLFNLLALALSALLIFLATRSVLLSFFLLINPVVLEIGHYTWSENAFFLSFALIFYSATRAFQGTGHLGFFFPLVTGLLIGVTSRYFFAPYAFLIFLSVWLVYGRGTAKKIFPYFAFAGILFVAYYLFNSVSTGHGSGMPRIDSPESIVYLAYYFVRYCLSQLVVYFAALLPILMLVVYVALSKGLVIFKALNSLGLASDPQYKPLALMALLGLAYLGLAFALRIHTQYDLYGSRTVGYGFVFLISAVAAWFLGRFEFGWCGIFSLLGIAILSVLLSQRDTYWELYSGSLSFSYGASFKEAMDAYDSKVDAEGIIIPFAVPSPRWSVSSNAELFYKKEIKAAKSPSTAPYREKETYEEFRDRLRGYGEHCHYDFTRITDVSGLHKIINAKHPVGFDFGGSVLRPELIEKERYHPSISKHLLEIFSPGKLVDCGL
jgi:hypothetical protein